MSGFRTELAGPLAAVIIQSAVDAIVVIDAQGRIEVFNPAAERLFGYAEAEVIGRNVSMLMPAPYRDEHDGYLKRYLDEGDARVIGIGREVQG
jgi:two-component system sensor kinase FixL